MRGSMRQMRRLRLRLLLMLLGCEWGERALIGRAWCQLRRFGARGGAGKPTLLSLKN
jgi:hypothetical protein